MSNEEIQRRIPHRAPMLLVDEIVEESESRIVCQKTFLPDEPFLQGHFPNAPIVPGVIQCECCLQAGAVLLAALLGEGFVGTPVATRMDGVKFKRMVRPGDRVEIETVLNQRVSNAFYLTGKMKHEGKLTMRLDFAVTFSPVAIGDVDAEEKA